jgi:large subunit ribosomal protein L30
MPGLNTKTPNNRTGRKPAGKVFQYRRGRVAGPYRYREGDLIEVELRKSRIGTNPKQRATLDSFKLGKLGRVKVVPFRPNTQGMLRVVEHLVAVRPHGLEEDTVSVRSYGSGGGESRLLDVRDGGLLRVEAQVKSFALMWPSDRGVLEFFEAAGVLQWPGAEEATLVPCDEDHGLQRVAVADIPEMLEEAPDAWAFVRLDFEGRALTWGHRYRDQERSGVEADPALAHAYEVSVSGRRFEREFAERLIKDTAVAPMAAIADSLMVTATETLSAYS